MDRALVLPPGRSYVERFEPRLYCFGERLLDTLAQGSIVVGRLGWRNGKKTRRPFVVESIAGIEPELAPLKELVAPPIGLPDEPTRALEAATPSRADDPDPVRLTLHGPMSIDAQSPTGIGVDVAVHSAGQRAVTLRFRPETLRFHVTGVAGMEDLQVASQSRGGRARAPSRRWHPAGQSGPQRPSGHILLPPPIRAAGAPGRSAAARHAAGLGGGHRPADLRWASGRASADGGALAPRSQSPAAATTDARAPSLPRRRPLPPRRRPRLRPPRPRPLRLRLRPRRRDAARVTSETREVGSLAGDELPARVGTGSCDASSS